MTIQQRENVGVVVDDFAAATAFFLELGLELEDQAVQDIEGRLRAHGAELVGEIAQYEQYCRYCYVRGPDGIIIGPVEELN
ncbi:hypothetical protein [Amycolatopsis sp.]|uniref:hypothetical protein n=1 Tax=Amycolatopsis sp. TaxID=37632 RepID=UPI002E0CE279|nr:hypothetical protein [Amycolatopsis sp.]